MMYIPFQNTFEQWWETHSIRSDLGLVRLEMRMARRLGTTHDRVLKAKDEILKSFNKDGILTDEEIYKEYKKYHTELEEVVKELRTIAINFKTLLNRDLDELEQLEQDVANNHEGQEETIREIHEMERTVELTIERFFRELTSFSSVNLSGQRLLGRASQIRELYYKLRKSRGEERDFKKAYKEVDSAERSGKVPSRKTVDTALATLKATLQDQTMAIGVVLLLFQELLQEISLQKQEIMGRVQHPKEGRGKYPQGWADDHIALLTNIEREIHEWVVHEVSAGRLFLSRAEHMAHERAA